MALSIETERDTKTFDIEPLISGKLCLAVIKVAEKKIDLLFSAAKSCVAQHSLIEL